MSYSITTFCYGNKYTSILPKWEETIKKKCKDAMIQIWKNCDIKLPFGGKYAWWDLVRLYHNLELLHGKMCPVVHIDLDLIIKKDIEPLINLEYDIIFSKEIGEDQAFPKECSQKVGFGICSGFYVIKPSGLNFMLNLFNHMNSYKYNTYSDQVTLMNYIVENNHTIKEEPVVLDGVTYYNKIIEIDGIRIGVLDFNIIIRDPILNGPHYGHHINVDNVGGTQKFLRYFVEDLETLPLTCRCGKLGDHSLCKHIEMRK
jgi:hypothetical protein